MAPSDAPAPTMVWSSSMKRMTLPDLRISAMAFFSRSSNSPRYFAPASMPARSRETTRLPRSISGMPAFDDELRQPFDDGGLAHARLADEHGIVLRAPGRGSARCARSPAARPMTGSSSPACAPGQVAGKLVERGRFLLLCGGAGGVLLAAAEGAQELFAGLAQIHAHLDHHVRSHAFAFAHQRQQYVLGADVVLFEFARLAHALFEHLLGARVV